MSVSWAWAMLIAAGVLEAGWAAGLKYTDGFTRLWPSVAVAVAIAISMGMVGVVAKTLPISTVYPVWVGIGAFGAVAFGIIVLKEPVGGPRLFFLALLLVSIVGLKASSSGEHVGRAPIAGEGEG